MNTLININKPQVYGETKNKIAIIIIVTCKTRSRIIFESC